MRVDKIEIDNFKNLKNFYLDLDETQLTNIFLGKNGAGKSNLLEALVIIFRDLDLKMTTKEFSYKIKYICNNYIVEIESDNVSNSIIFKINDNDISKAQFYKTLHQKDSYLPEHVFAYYSGPSNRLESHFSKHHENFYKALLNGEEETLRPLFYARLIHSHFVLLAFFSFFDSVSSKFLRDYLNIISVESILFVLKEPIWNKTKKVSKQEFWGSRGVVRNFLNDLYKHAIAPLKETVTFKEGFSNRKKEVIYLYLKDQESLMQFAEKYGNNTEFFKNLESTYLSDLIHEIRIKVKKLMER